MDFSLNIDGNGRPQASLDTADNLQNAVLLSLHVRRGAFFLNPNFGSRLHEITTLSDSNVTLARQYAAECLEWLRRIKWAAAIDVSAARASGGRLKITVSLTRAGGQGTTYETFLKVV